MSFAKNTKVNVGRSQAEIRKTLSAYKASGFAFAEQQGKAVIFFEMKNRRIRFTFNLPVYGKWKMPKTGYIGGEKHCEQEERRLWRCALLAIKSKLECVESGITTFEQEFLAHMVLPNNRTVGDEVLPQIEDSYASGQMPPLLGYGG